MKRRALLPMLKARLAALQKRRPDGGSSPTRDALVRHARAALHDIAERAAAGAPAATRDREHPIVDPRPAPAGKRGLVTRLARSEHRQTALLLLTYAASRLSKHLSAETEPQRPVPPERRPEHVPVPVAAEPQKLTDLSARRWRDTFKRTLVEFRADDLTDWAAALTYYAVLSLFPTVIVLIAILGLAGQYPQTSDALLTIIGRVGPASAVDTFREPIEGVVKAKGGAGLLLGFGLVGAIWSASAYIGAFFRAANVVYETREGRQFWKLRPLQVLVTIGMTLLLALVGIAIVTTGPLAEAVGDAIGLGSTTLTIWNWAKWPLLLVIVSGMIAVLYYVAPNVKQPGLRWISPGSAIALVAWILASAMFALYVSQFGSYNKTYGTLGGVIVFLVWLWISNVALLFGLEFDAELERSRELAAGDRRARDEIQLEPREAPKPAR